MGVIKSPGLLGDPTSRKEEGEGEGEDPISRYLGCGLVVVFVLAVLVVLVVLVVPIVLIVLVVLIVPAVPVVLVVLGVLVVIVLDDNFSMFSKYILRDKEKKSRLPR
jgi:hypothetical protein